MTHIMDDLEGKRYAFTLVEECRADDGGYIPCVAVEGEPGYRPMGGNGPCASPWNWGKDRELAKRLCDEKNERLGLSSVVAWKIVASSMFAKKV